MQSDPWLQNDEGFKVLKLLYCVLTLNSVLSVFSVADQTQLIDDLDH